MKLIPLRIAPASTVALAPGIALAFMIAPAQARPGAAFNPHAGASAQARSRRHK